MLIRRIAFLALTLWPGLTLTALSDAETEAWKEVQPVFEQKCYECHGGKKTKGGVDLKKLEGDPKLATEYEVWEKAKEAIASGDMPPDEKSPLAKAERELTLKWITESLEETIREHAGDPGTVTMRRLTNAEYDHTIRDLAGLDLGLSKGFAPDGGGGEGFSNVGDVLFVSPQQLEKYFAAARKLADYATIMPGSGIAFQAQRVGMRGPAQVKAQAEQALYVWYQKMAGPILPKDSDDAREAAYMTACWQWKHREITGAASLEELAKETGLTLPFLQNWWSLLNSVTPKSRYLDLTRVAWRTLPPPDAAAPRAVPEAVRAKIVAIQAAHRSWFGPARRPAAAAGLLRTHQVYDGSSLVEYRSDVTGKTTVHIVLGDVGEESKGDWVTFDGLLIRRTGNRESYLDWLRSSLSADQDALAKPDADAASLKARLAEEEAALARFGKDPRGGPAKPDAIVALAPAIITLPLPADAKAFVANGKLDIDGPDIDSAAVQWLATANEPPDPRTVLPGVLTIWKRKTSAATRLSGEFFALQTAFPDTSARRLSAVARNYTNGRKGAGVYYLSDAQLVSMIPPAEKAHWEKMMADWKLVQGAELSAQQVQEWDDAVKRHLLEFAARAWRHPLNGEETAQIAGVYDTARARDLDRESAGREALVRALVSPRFLFKLEDASQPGVQPLTAWELATRLSYFLWASTPDETLRAAAADGSLLQPEIVERETRRLLRDPRASALAEEFAGQWLKFNGFEATASIDANKFPEFTPELRHDMYRETVEFFTHLIREDRPVREIVTADYTFLNERLAKFYGIPGVTGEEFRQVSAAEHERGGVLGMGSLLAKNSYPLRTSPVLRGNWLLTSILGTPTPPPPDNVPKLDDSVSQASTLRERLERHRADKACAVCHEKFDPLGFALEGFDPIGRLRTLDEAGLEIDNSGQGANGATFRGVDGLRKFLTSHETELNANFCGKLVGYALGRSLLLTDRPLIETMRSDLARSDDRFSAAILDLTKSSPEFPNPGKAQVNPHRGCYSC